MSVVVAIKYKDGVLLGGDTQITEDGHLSAFTDSKIFKNKYSNTAIGIVGALRDLNLLENEEEYIDYKSILDKTFIDKKYVISNVVPKIFKILEKNHRLYKENELLYSYSECLFGTSNSIFNIGFDGAVSEKEKYYAIGCGKELVIGFLDVFFSDNKEKDLTLKDAKTLINKSIAIACQKDVYINDKITYINLIKEE